MKILSEELKKKRNANKLSLRAVEKETGISFSTIRRIEEGHGEPELETIEKLCRWLNIPITDIVENAPISMHITHKNADEEIVKALVEMGKQAVKQAQPCPLNWQEQDGTGV